MKIDTSKPTNLKMIKMTDGLKNRLKPITTGQIFSDTLFHPEGLFSTEIFGGVGSEERNQIFARIDLNLRIFQPNIYKYLCELKGLYQHIMEGTAYATWNEKTKDFDLAEGREGNTGFYYFYRKFKEIDFKETGSETRSFKIKVIKNAIEEDNATIDAYMVIPAGYRDYIMGRNGRPEEDEINSLYRVLIGRASVIDPQRAARGGDLYSDAAIGIQRAVADIDAYISTLLDGKRKLPQSKWKSRKIFNSTANVASAYANNTHGRNDPRQISYNDTIIGMYQYLTSAKPMSQSEISGKYIPYIFPQGSSVAYLTNLETMKKEEVPTSGLQRDIDLWTTPDGVEKIIASLANTDIRELPVLFRLPNDKKKTYCIGLLYKDDNHFRFLQDIDDLPEHLDKSKVSPITLFEFIYMSTYHMSGKYYGVVKRYPIQQYGSIYPCRIVFQTTAKNQTLRELGDDWLPLDGDNYNALFFPIRGEEYINTIVVGTSHLGALGGDKYKVLTFRNEGSVIR